MPIPISTKLAAVSAVFAAGVAVWLLSGEPRPPAVASAVEAPSETAELRRELSQVRAELQTLETRTSGELRVPVHVPEPHPTAAADEAPASAPDPEQQIDDVEIGLDLRLEAESVDRTWEGEVHRQLAAAVASDVLGRGQLRKSDCRSTLCRIEVAHADVAGQEQFLEHVTSTPPFASGGFFRRLDHEREPSLVVYFAREGHEL